MSLKTIKVKEGHITDKVSENCIEWLDDSQTVSLTLSKSSLSSKLKKAAASHPEMSLIAANKDGSIFAHIPLEWVKIEIPRAKKIAKQES